MGAGPAPIGRRSPVFRRKWAEGRRRHRAAIGGPGGATEPTQRKRSPAAKRGASAAGVRVSARGGSAPSEGSFDAEVRLVTDRWKRLASAVMGVLLMGLVGCAGSGGSPTENLSDSAALHRARYIVVDLATGSHDAFATIADLDTAAAYRTTHMVFVRLPAASAELGSAAFDYGHQEDEALRSFSSQDLLVAVFPCTRAQWQLIAGATDTPWSTLPAGLLGDGSDTSLPAHNLSPDRIREAIDTYNSAHPDVLLRLPSDDEWEYACRHGATTRDYCFANSRTVITGTDVTRAPPTTTTIAEHAVVWETSDTDGGPQPVGERSPSSAGLYDMHGNVWEATADGTLRGGSWRDTIMQARCANRNAVDVAVAHPLVGFRLVFVP